MVPFQHRKDLQEHGILMFKGTHSDEMQEGLGPELDAPGLRRSPEHELNWIIERFSLALFFTLLKRNGPVSIRATLRPGEHEQEERQCRARGLDRKSSGHIFFQEKHAIGFTP